MENTENITGTAIDHFHHGFSCSASVLSAFSEKYGLDEETALKMACPLGAGCRTGNVCGAVSGALLVVGLRYGQYLDDDMAAKSNCNAKAAEFNEKFKEKFGSLICRELLGIDISVPGNYEIAAARNLFRTNCDNYVSSAVETLEELGY